MELDRIRRCAQVSVGRACGFAALAVGMVMLGLVFEPPLAFRSGAALAGVLAVVLHILAERAPARPYRRTEVWMLLDEKPRLPAARLQEMIGGTLQQTYRRYAGRAAAACTGFACAGWVTSAAG